MGHDGAMWHPRERDVLADALLAAGPGAPTLCDGWRTEHLAAHLVLRERSPLTAAGIAVPLLAERTERVTIATGDAASDPAGYAALVARFRRGAPWWSPVALGGDPAQLLEFFVHAEDVRRGAGPAPARVLPPGEVDALWALLPGMARLMYRATLRTDGLVLRAPDRAARVGAPRDTDVVLRGEVGELVLHAFGRAAQVEVTGDPAAVARMVDAARRV